MALTLLFAPIVEADQGLQEHFHGAAENGKDLA
jgi:hypothetical protein